MTGFPDKKIEPPATTTPPTPAADPVTPITLSFKERLKLGLERTRDTLNTPVGELFSRKPVETPTISSPTPSIAPPPEPIAAPAVTPIAAPPAPPAAAQPLATPSAESTESAAPASSAPASFLARTIETLNTPVGELFSRSFDSADANAEAGPSWKERLKVGLARTRDTLNTPVTELFSRAKIDDELLEDLETTLLMADCGVDATHWLLDELKATVKREKLESPASLRGALIDSMETLLHPLEQPLDLRATPHNPFIVMIVGVNGAGKTTSIGKLAKHFQSQGKSVLLAAGDTFRAAAREQLATWGERNNVTVITQQSGDPAAVVFDAIHAARARKIDVVLADTAGRLPTQLHLMEEIAKVVRVIKKAEPSGPHEVLLVLDANIGQNAIQQVKAFDKAVQVTGLVVTKLDGTAKGGVLAAIARQCPKPVRFIGVGEGIDDLQAFRSKEFVEALFGESNERAPSA